MESFTQVMDASLPGFNVLNRLSVALRCASSSEIEIGQTVGVGLSSGVAALGPSIKVIATNPIRKSAK
jgi:hypothetical protein